MTAVSSAGKPPPGRDAVREAAVRALASGMAETQLAEGAGEILEPIPIQAPGGKLAGWFVGIAVGERLAGFLQLAVDLGFRRYASFQRRPPSVENCPLVADWLDPARILARARTQANAGERLAEPFLTFDRSPDRLVWAVTATDAAGGESTLHVAGDFVYRVRSGGGIGGP